MVTNYLSDEEFSMLYRKTEQLQYAKREMVFKQGSPFLYVGFLSEGLVKQSYFNKGKETILSVIKGPALIGGANFFLGDSYFTSFVTLSDCKICLIEVSILKESILKNGLLAFGLTSHVAESFKDSILNFINKSQKQVQGKIAGILLYFADKIFNSNQFDILLSRKEISDFAGCSEENVINTLSKMAKEGIIKINNKKIDILQKEKLGMIFQCG
ncbi:MAG: Crp/Fnr family transcriptional regulator [Bacteroidota bacterium]